MGAFYDDIPEFLIEWIGRQHMFWVATAPLSPTGHVNVSPKGLARTFKVLDNRTVMYQDITGSGSETIAHLRENGRITVMLQEFEGAPRIVRLFGTGVWHEFGTDEYNHYIPSEERLAGSRAAIVVHVHKVGSSCGFAVPFYKFTGHRTQLIEYFDKLEAKDAQAADGRAGSGLLHYWGWKNSASVDGLPGLFIGEQYAKYFKLDPLALSPFVPKKDRQKAIGGGGQDATAAKMALLVKDISRNVFEVRFLLGLVVGAFLMMIREHM